jgi:hypothetical protein
MQLGFYANGIKNTNLVLCEVFVEKFQKSNNFEFIVLLITLTKLLDSLLWIWQMINQAEPSVRLV